MLLIYYPDLKSQNADIITPNISIGNNTCEIDQDIMKISPYK